MGILLIGIPGRDYPLGYLFAALFFIVAVALFIISFFIKEDAKKEGNKDLPSRDSDEPDLYSDDYDTPALDYSEDFADEIIRMIEEEEKAQEAAAIEQNPSQESDSGDNAVAQGRAGQA